MLVYGDRMRRCSAAEFIAGLRSDMHQAAAMGPGLARHSLLVALLIDAGMLAQGVADLGTADHQGVLLPNGADAAAMELTTAIARCCAMSWLSGHASCGELPTDQLARCEMLVPDDPLSIGLPEGYAFYAVYPEAYLEAALRCRSASQCWRVLGLRSIGTSLAAMTAVGLGAPVPWTARPSGHPFDREIVDTPPREIGQGGAFAVVDEGPGLSGSSMAAAARWLQRAGTPLDRIHFFPSHVGDPGPQATRSTRELWAAVGKQHVSFDQAIGPGAEPAHRLRTWVETLLGPLVAPLQDIGDGAWRELQRSTSRQARPPAHPWQERRKYLAHAHDGVWLVKFAGLGRMGERALARARVLGAAGFAPMPLGLCHGFIVERWRGDLAPLALPTTSLSRAHMVTRVGDYLGFRARRFPADPNSGAGIEAILNMTACNVQEALGREAAARCAMLEPALRRAWACITRVETDNRMHRWEWLEGPSVLLKTDAIDHAMGHDLVGCQDIAWDIIGAEIELELSPAEASALVERIQNGGTSVNVPLIALLRPSYLAFQWAHFSMAAAVAFGPAQQELSRESERYRARLKATLHHFQ
jgi:hypothetical protein